jgi:hypothetical protein
MVRQIPIEESRRRRAARMNWLKSAMERLDRLAELGPDWDSYGAGPITAEAIATGRRIVSLLSLVSLVAPDLSEPFVCPCNDGGLQLEWHEGGVDVEIYVGHDGHLTGWASDGTRDWDVPEVEEGKPTVPEPARLR